MNKLKQQTASIMAIGIACLLLNACTVQHARIPPGAVPEAYIPTAAEEDDGKRIFVGLREKYRVDSAGLRHDQLTRVFNHLARGATIDSTDWHVFLFDDPEITDIRAVQGNFIFVWSGIFEVAENEDEIAGLLACEMAHGLARHTEPVEFSLATELLFGMTDIATSIGLIVLTQGAVAVSGTGMTRWAYVEAADLDPVDRVYDDEQIQEMTQLALLILARSNYSPEALLQFWRRAEENEVFNTRVKRLSRRISPRERVAILEAAMSELPVSQEPDDDKSKRGQVLNLESLLAPDDLI